MVETKTLNFVSAVKNSNFIPSDPSLWFSLLESTFELAILKPIIESKTKYNYWIIYLSPDAIILGRDIILNPDQTDPYTHLKDYVISCGESETEEIDAYMLVSN